MSLTPAQKKLVEISSKPLGENPVRNESEVGVASNNWLMDSLWKLLSIKNGFLAFESALHVFPVENSKRSYTIEAWNTESLWRSRYGRLLGIEIFFAQDAFGNQFYCGIDGIYLFDAETAESTLISPTLARIMHQLEEQRYAAAG